MLIVFASHPIQYQVPIWKRLGQELGDKFLVIYLCKQGVVSGLDDEFAREVFWDFDLFDGYHHRFIESAPDRVLGFWHNRIFDYRGLIAELRHLQPKNVLVHGWNLVAYVEVAFLVKFLFPGTKLWIRSESNNYKQYSKWKRIIRRLLLSMFFKLFDKFFFIGSANRELYQDFGVEEARLVKAGYGVDTTKFKASQHSLGHKRLIRERFGLSADTKVIMFCGKLIAKKRPLDLVDALLTLGFKSGNSTLQLFFVGSGELSGAVLEKSASIKKCNYEPVVLAGFLNQSEIADAYAIADLLVLPSDASETWGLVVNEALASGLPVVVSESCGCAVDLVTPNYPELVFPEGNIKAMARAIEQGLLVARSGVSENFSAKDYSVYGTSEILLLNYE